MHEPGYVQALGCGGGTAASQRTEVEDFIITTCLWCIVGAKNNLRWFKYADEK